MPSDNDDPKVFDVSKPHKTTPSASSRPIIVGHHPIMADPMVLEERYRHPEPLHPQLVEQEKTQEPVSVGSNIPSQEPINLPSETQASVIPQVEKAYTTYGAPEQPLEQPLEQPIEKSSVEPSQMPPVAPIFDGYASDGINQKTDQTSSTMPQQPLSENPLHLPAGAAGKDHTKNQIWLAIILLVVIAIIAFLVINFLLK